MKKISATKLKPRAVFCWECGKLLRQRRIFLEVTINGHPRILHRMCAKPWVQNKNWTSDEEE